MQVHHELHWPGEGGGRREREKGREGEGGRGRRREREKGGEGEGGRGRRREREKKEEKERKRTREKGRRGYQTQTCQALTAAAEQAE